MHINTCSFGGKCISLEKSQKENHPGFLERSFGRKIVLSFVFFVCHKDKSFAHESSYNDIMTFEAFFRNVPSSIYINFILQPEHESYDPVKMDNSCVGNDDIRNNNNANNDNFTANEYYNKDYFSFSVKQKQCVSTSQMVGLALLNVVFYKTFGENVEFVLSYQLNLFFQSY